MTTRNKAKHGSSIRGEGATGPPADLQVPKSWFAGSSTQVRAVSSFVSVGFLVWALFFAPVVFMVTILLLMIGGTNEIISLTKATHNDLGKHGSLAAYATTGLLWYSAVQSNTPEYLGLIVAFALVFSELAMMMQPLKRNPKTRVASNLYASLYMSIPLTLILIVYLHYKIGASTGLAARMLLLLLVPIWAGDVAAYFGGRKYGRTKLAPTISPGKTLEGFLFGFVAAVISAILWRYLFLSEIPGMFLSFTRTLMIGLVIAIFGPIGDLAASVLKRQARVKDSGRFLPGHGGILDRFDSLMLAGVFYFALCYGIIPPEILANL